MVDVVLYLIFCVCFRSKKSKKDDQVTVKSVPINYEFMVIKGAEIDMSDGEDYVNEDLLFLGTEFGLFITIDGGKNWSRFTNKMPTGSN